MLGLALHSVRGRAWAFAGSFAALLLGVAILSASLLVYAGAQPEVPQRLSQADVIVHAPLVSGELSDEIRPWTSEAATALAQRLSTTGGVKHAVPDRTFHAQIPGGVTEGHNWSSIVLGTDKLESGRGPTAEGEVAAPAEPGTALSMLTASGPVPVTVVGKTQGLYAADAWAATLAPGVEAIGLVTDGTADLSTVDLSGGTAVTGTQRAVLEPEAVAKQRWIGTQLLIAMAFLATFVTVFVVSSTFALAAAQRRRELGLLRAIGATGRQARRLLLGEAAAVGATAAGIGALLGLALAPGFIRQLFAWELTPFPRVRLEAWPVALAWLLGVCVALIGAWTASRRAASAGPLEALREAVVEHRPSRVRMVLGGLALALGVWLAIGTASAASEDRIDKALLTACVLIAAATLWAPVVVGPVVRLLTLPMRGPAGMVVRAEMLTARRRSASLVAPVIATVGFAVMLTGMVQTMMTAYPAGKAEELRGMTIVVPVQGSPGLSDAAVAAAGGGEAYLEARVSINDTSVEVRGSMRVSDGIAVDGYAIGSTVPVTFADGQTVPLTVTANQPLPTLSWKLLREHDRSALAPSVLGGTTAGPGATVVDAKAYAEAEAASETRLLWLFALVLIALSVGYTGLSVLNTVGMSIAARRTDLRILNTSGATLRQVRRFALLEAFIAVVAGAALGIVVTVPPLLGMAQGLQEETRLPVSLALNWPALAATIAGCLLFATFGALINLRRRTTMGA